MPTIKPIKLVDPWIILGEDDPIATPPTVAVDVKCFSKGIHLLGEEDDALATFCDPLGYSWMLSIDFLMSIGPDSLDEALQSLGGPGTVIPFEFAYTNDPASASNPHWTGKVRLTAYPIVDAQINEPTEFTMEMDVIGDILRDDGTIVLNQAGEAVTREDDSVAA